MWPQAKLPQFAEVETKSEKEVIYPFCCYDCDVDEALDCAPLSPPNAPTCPSCGEPMSRVFGCNINTAGCRDCDFIPERSRVVDSDRRYNQNLGISKEQQFHQVIKKRRAALADGGNKGAFRHTNSVPAELYHGKIKETGDKDYWKDQKNLERHKSTKVG